MMEPIERALNYAANAHGLQKRDGGELFIEHPRRVVGLLRKMGASEPTLVAGALHDVLEDTNVSFNELASAFGSYVAGLVREVTKPNKPVSTAAWTIKAADSLDNLTDMEPWNEGRRERYRLKKRYFFFPETAEKTNQSGNASL